MASGMRWEDYVERAIACPPEFPFGTKIIVDGKEWICLDRGGKITFDANANAYWIDFLTHTPAHAYGEIIEGIISYSSE